MNTIEEELVRLEEKIDAVYASVEKGRRYHRTMMIITLVTIVLPIILAIFAIPMALNSLGEIYQI